MILESCVRLTSFIAILGLAWQPTFAAKIERASASDPSIVSTTSFYASSELFLIAGDYSEELILLSGKIENGDAESLIRVIAQLPNPYGVTLNLDSPGGNVIEALHIASLVSALHLHTFVPGGGICASACFFVFLAGDGRLAGGAINGGIPKGIFGYIGLHRPHLTAEGMLGSGPATEARQHYAMLAISGYLRDHHVPQRLADIMMARPSNDIYWMTDSDLAELGPYTPEIEELLIARCNYNRNMFEDPDLSSSNVVVARRAQERGYELAKMFAACRKSALTDLMEESLRNKQRLQAGWRPWAVQKKSTTKK